MEGEPSAHAHTHTHLCEKSKVFRSHVCIFVVRSVVVLRLSSIRRFLVMWLDSQHSHSLDGKTSRRRVPPTSRRDLTAAAPLPADLCVCGFSVMCLFLTAPLSSSHREKCKLLLRRRWRSTEGRRWRRKMVSGERQRWVVSSEKKRNDLSELLLISRLEKHSSANSCRFLFSMHLLSAPCFRPGSIMVR